jgi:hypothetical protein
MVIKADWHFLTRMLGHEQGQGRQARREHVLRRRTAPVCSRVTEAADDPLSVRSLQVLDSVVCVLNASGLPALAVELSNEPSRHSDLEAGSVVRHPCVA